MSRAYGHIIVKCLSTNELAWAFSAHDQYIPSLAAAITLYKVSVFSFEDQ